MSESQLIAILWAAPFLTLAAGWLAGLAFLFKRRG